jgi:precorrin-3B synthase
VAGRTLRNRSDRCPGILRPWPAPDGGLVRVRLLGGAVTSEQLLALSEIARRHGGGDLHLTSRANVQLRALPLTERGELPPDIVAAIEATGLLPSRVHDRARNVLVSPLTGRAGGRVDVRPIARELDRLICAAPALADLPGRFLFVLDDGRGDVLDAPVDLGLVAMDEESGQLRHGRDSWGAVVPLGEAAAALVELAARFLQARGTGSDAPWHVDELAGLLADNVPRDPRTRVHLPPLPYGGAHVAAPDGVLGVDPLRQLATRGRELVVTPWRGVVVTEEIG